MRLRPFIPSTVLSAILLFVLSLHNGCIIGEKEAETKLNTESRAIINNKSKLTEQQLRQRIDIIRNRALLKGLTNPLIIAGVTYHETGMAQCSDEYSLAHCSNIGTSIDCPNATGVLGGGGDGPCSSQQGGIGMFQFDNGTYTQTTTRYGQGILTLNGNIDAGIDFIINKIGFTCPCTPCFAAGSSLSASPTCAKITCQANENNSEDRMRAIAWFNSIRPNTPEYDTYLRALSHCYNGCIYGRTNCPAGSHEHIKGLYKKAIDDLYQTFGYSFWYPSTSSTCSGNGAGGYSGSKCLQSCSFNVLAGKKYTISTCNQYTGDTYLKVTGACACEDDDDCDNGFGSICDCTATADGTATICASTFETLSASWNYKVTKATNSCKTIITPSGSGSNGNNGANCLAQYPFQTIAGQKYKISTCGVYGGDTFVKVTGTCTCQNDDACSGLGSECDCTATADGTATVCASSYKTASASWQYFITCQ